MKKAVFDRENVSIKMCEVKAFEEKCVRKKF